MSLKYLLSILFALVFLFSVTFADEEVEVEIEDDVDEELENAPVPPAAMFPLHTSYVFPEFPEEKLPIGDVVDVLLGVANNGDQDFTIEAMQGFLVSPVDYSFFLQNFTAFWYNTSVPASHEATTLYRFRSNPNLEPREYALIVQAAFRASDNSTFAYTLFNSTMIFEEVAEGFNPNDIFAYTAIMGTFGLIGFGIFKLIENRQPKKKEARPSTPETTPEDTGDVRTEWLPAEELRRMEQRKTKKSAKQKGSSNKPRKPLYQPKK